MRCLTYADLETASFAKKIAKVRAAIEAGDLRSPDVRKLEPGPYHRAKLDDASRLLLQFVRHNQETICLFLEVIPHHAYDKSRFLRGAKVDETKLQAALQVEPAECSPIRYVHPTRPDFLLLDKPLSLDDAQHAVLAERPPLILVGSAGSGKTALLLQRLRQASGRVAYLTESRWLAETSRGLYVAFDGAPEEQEAEFLSYQQLLETVHVPAGRPVLFADFKLFFAKYQQMLRFADAHAVFEELRGVLTAEPEGPFTRQDYLELGVKQSLFQPQERTALYDVFERYGPWLAENGLYEQNLVAHQQLPQVAPVYDFIAVDEVQDLTNVQLAFILKSLKSTGKFILAGDANQIVHPNYFSWSKVKSLFWRGQADVHQRLHMLTVSYRNSPEVTTTANRVLRLKNLRFGAIDKESNLLMQAVGGIAGTVASLSANSTALRDLDQRTSQSTRVGVVVLRDEHKADARRVFKTPLLFSIHEAKGLEYETVILYRLVSAERKLYADLAEGVAPADLEGDELAYRRGRDKTDKSLELYKFFVNALYVALTRSVRDVYLVEDDVRHPLLALLGVEQALDARGVATQKASAEEWQREAQRLAAQGKNEQAEAIRRDVLKQEPVPWVTFDGPNLAGLLHKALDVKLVSQKTRQQMLEFAYFHDERALVARLEREVQVGHAATFAKERPRATQAAIQRCLGKGTAQILRDTEQYGVDHRLQVGLTPLMLAAYVGNVPLVQALGRRGAGKTARDHLGRGAVHWALRGAQDGYPGARENLGIVYDLVAPASFDIEAEGRLHQIGREQGEYFLFTLMLACLSNLFRDEYGRIRGFSAANLQEGIDALPEVVLKSRRKKREYLNNVLARACVGSTYTPCRQLWVRERHGEYMLNPNLNLRVTLADGTQVWQPLREVLGMAWLEAHRNKHWRPKPVAPVEPTFTPAQLAVARAMAPGIEVADLLNLRRFLREAPAPGASAAEKKHFKDMAEFMDYVLRAKVGPIRLKVGPRE